MKITEIQRELAELDLDAWLLYDFRGINLIAQNVAGLAGAHITRRWFCLIPASGEPRWLVHRIETSNFTDVQGQVALYAGWEELNGAIQTCYLLVSKRLRWSIHQTPRSLIFHA